MIDLKGLGKTDLTKLKDKVDTEMELRGLVERQKQITREATALLAGVDYILERMHEAAAENERLYGKAGREAQGRQVIEGLTLYRQSLVEEINSETEHLRKRITRLEGRGE